MGNAAIDYEKQNALEEARMEPQRAEHFNVPQNGHADNYSEDSEDENGNTEEKSDEEKHAERLEKARSGSGEEGEAKKMKNLAEDAAKIATPMGAFSLLKQINPIGDIPFAAAIIASMLKDILDVPTFATAIIPFIFSLLCGIFVFMMILLVGANENKKIATKLIKKAGIIASTTITGLIPGLNILPEATIGTLLVFFTTLSERKHSQDANQDQDEKETDDTEEELKEAA